jgi:hypothetical protein
MWLFILVIIILLSLAIFIEVKRPFLIGRSGESFVSGELFQLDPAHYKVLNNLLLPSRSHSKTTQIDHVVVSNFGIFCIETKAYSGWIFGNANQEYWTQVIFRYKKRFYNPLRQNYAHVKAVEYLIKPYYPKLSVVSFIAFPYADKLKISGTDLVGHMRDVVNKIKSFTNQILSDTERDNIYGILERTNIHDKEVRKSHNRTVKDLKKY